MKRMQDSIRGSRIQPIVVPWASRKHSPERIAEHKRRQQLKVEADKFMVEMGLALVSMQEQELDENGHREQTDELPDWRKVAKFIHPKKEDKAPAAKGAD